VALRASTGAPAGCKVIEERLRRVARARSVDDGGGDGIETGAVDERGDDLERREDGQLDGPCVPADVAVICRRCRAALPCVIHVLEAGWSARDQLPRLDQGGEAELHVSNPLQDRS